MRAQLLSNPFIVGALLLCVTVAGLWFPHLRASLWLDELQTAWAVQGSLQEVISRVFHTQGFSPFYYLIVWGLPWQHSELNLRLPSVFFALGAAAVLYRIARRFLPPRAAWFALLVFVSLDECVDMAINARPYALAQFCAVASTYLFMRWAHDGVRVFALPYALAVVLTIYAHFLFAGIVLIHAIYWMMFRTRMRLPPRKLFWGFIYILIGCVPLIPQVSSMLEKREAMAIGAMPQWYDVILAPIPWVAAISLVLAYLLAAAFSATFEKHAPSKDSDLPAYAWLSPEGLFPLVWMVVPPLALITASWVLESSLYVPRYYAWAAPGIALTAGYASSRVPKLRHQLMWLLFFALFTVSAGPTKERFFEDWRSAAAFARQRQEQTRAPLLLYSGVIESSRAEWLMDPIKQGQFASPIFYYPVLDPWYLLPFSFESEGAREYWENSLLPKIAGMPRVIVLLLDNLSWEAEEGQRTSIRKEVAEKLAQEGYVLADATSFGRVWVMSFEGGASETLSANSGKA